MKKMTFLFTFVLMVLWHLSMTSLPNVAQQPRVLVFSRTTGFRHDSIPDGIAAVRQLGQQNGFDVDATEDAAAFTDANLVRYQAVVFLNTTGDVLDNNQQMAFERYISNGGGFVGVHSATDTEYDWAWYGGLIGAYFQSHPDIQRATIRLEDSTHPSTLGLPAVWQRTDEWYNFRLNPRGQVKVLARLDESSYSGGTMGADHPICWCQLYDGGRSWYAAGGHTKESYSEPLFRQHLLGGIQFAAKIRDGSCSAITGVSAASFKSDLLASESIVTLFGSAFSDRTQAAATNPLPTALADVSVKVRDGQGTERFAPLFFVSPTQINLLIPPSTIYGTGSITIVKANGRAPSGATQFSQVAPGIFTANASGQGVAAGIVLRVKNNVKRFEPISQFDVAQQRFVPLPIDLGPPSDEVYLVLFGTGFRQTNTSGVTVKIGGQGLPVLYVGPQGEFAGLDQINVLLPGSLTGKGETGVEIKANGSSANTVRIHLK